MAEQSPSTCCRFATCGTSAGLCLAALWVIACNGEVAAQQAETNAASPQVVHPLREKVVETVMAFAELVTEVNLNHACWVEIDLTGVSEAVEIYPGMKTSGLH